MKITRIETHVLLDADYDPAASVHWAAAALDGIIPLPAAVGLGVEIDPDALARLKIDCR